MSEKKKNRPEKFYVLEYNGRIPVLGLIEYVPICDAYFDKERNLYTVMKQDGDLLVLNRRGDPEKEETSPCVDPFSIFSRALSGDSPFRYEYEDESALHGPRIFREVDDAVAVYVEKLQKLQADLGEECERVKKALADMEGEDADDQG